MDFNPTAEEVINELSNYPDGKVQLELAVLRAVVARQKKYIEESVTEDDNDDTDK
tara:strand:- start:165 stop:329 length:165 start_codon:yes stop_codon:yes gene_type:complete